MSLKWEDKGIKTPLTRARGLGAAHEGSGTWMKERISSVASLPLVIWLVWAVVSMPGWDYETFTAWQAQPLNAVLMILSIVAIFWHAALGSRVVVEDYIAHEGFKMFKLIAIQLFFAATAVACIFAVLKIAFTV